MFEEPISSILPSLWESMNSWFTPTIFFVLLNLVIGTIVFTSSLATKRHHHPLPHHHHHHHQQEVQHQQYGHQIARSPSMLQRLKSINFYNYRSQQEPSNISTYHEKLPHQDQFEQAHEFFTTTTPPFQQQLEPQEQQPPLSRSPSVLQRLQSINIYNYFSSHHQDSIFTTSTHTQQEISHTHFSQEPIYQNPSHEQEPQCTLREREEKNEEIEDQEQTLEEIYSKLKGFKVVNRSKSDTKTTSGEVPTKLSKEMRKSASTKPAFSHFGGGDQESEVSVVESRRPATMREGKAKATVADVDAQADDFINKFKQQLKLQRIDSFIRYKETKTRGSEK